MNRQYQITTSQLASIASYLVSDQNAFDTDEQHEKFKNGLLELICDHCGGVPDMTANNEISVGHNDNLPENGGIWALGKSMPKNSLLIPDFNNHNSFSLTGRDYESDIWINIENMQIHIVPQNDSVVVNYHSQNTDLPYCTNEISFTNIENDICCYWGVSKRDVESFITEQGKLLSDVSYAERAKCIVQYHQHCVSLGSWNDEDRMEAFCEGWSLNLSKQPIKVDQPKAQTVYPINDSLNVNQVARIVLNGTQRHHRKARFLIRSAGETEFATLLVDAKQAVN